MPSTIAPQLMHRVSMDLMEDLSVLYGLGVNNPDEPEPDKARQIASQLTAPWQLYWLSSRAGIGLHTESAITSSWDMTAAVIAAFYSRVRAPTWVQHPESAQNAMKAKETADGRVLMASAQTLTQSLVSAGYPGNFEGPPTVVAAHIRNWMKENT